VIHGDCGQSRNKSTAEDLGLLDGLFGGGFLLKHPINSALYSPKVHLQSTSSANHHTCYTCVE
jgi:hypothetical protein